MKESAYQSKVLKYCRKRGAYVENIWGGGYQSAGIPDLIGCYRGVFFGIELKVGHNKPSVLQKAKVNIINNTGGVAIVCWDKLDPIVEMFDWIDDQLRMSDFAGEMKINQTKRFNYEGATANGTH